MCRRCGTRAPGTADYRSVGEMPNREEMDAQPRHWSGDIQPAPCPAVMAIVCSPGGVAQGSHPQTKSLGSPQCAVNPVRTTCNFMEVPV